MFIQNRHYSIVISVSLIHTLTLSRCLYRSPSHTCTSSIEVNNTEFRIDTHSLSPTTVIVGGILVAPNKQPKRKGKGGGGGVSCVFAKSRRY